ncbi:hypothetical protein [Streptomyces sp. NPDC051567]|uniref:hypothetical protein n=1 Tax=Streptomyces sp. NPDC051567 TaxID=3365660 RepID=UPI0037A9C18C
MTVKKAVHWLAEADELYEIGRRIVLTDTGSTRSAHHTADDEIALYAANSRRSAAFTGLAEYARRRAADQAAAECGVCHGAGRVYRDGQYTPCTNRITHTA